MSSIEKMITNFNATKYDTIKNIFVLDKKPITVEKTFKFLLNGEPFREVFCSPCDIEDFCVGFLAQEKKIYSAEDIISLEIKDSLIDVKIKSGIKPAQVYFANDVTFIAKDILACADKLLSELSTTHAKTNGTHSGALSDGKNILLLREDIGRHNVFDKIHGAAIRDKIFLGNKILIFSGRCSSEMISKLGRMGTPAVLAKSVPTTLAIDIAQKLGITLAAKLSAGSFCIYTNPQRIVLS